MAEKLSERSELGGSSQGTDLIHVVRGGLSYKRQLDNMFNSGHFPQRTTVGNAEIVTFKKDMSGSGVGYDEDDILIYIDTTADVMVVGICLTTISSFPTDLDDPAKFGKFYTGGAAI